MPAIVQQLEVLGPFMKEGAQLASAVSGFVATMQVGRVGGRGLKVAAQGLPIINMTPLAIPGCLPTSPAFAATAVSLAL